MKDAAERMKVRTRATGPGAGPHFQRRTTRTTYIPLHSTQYQTKQLSFKQTTNLLALLY